MRVFLTGASGYIGSSVARALTRAGHDAVGLVRKPEQAKRLEAHEGTAVLGEMGDPGTWREAAGTCGALIHCAADGSASQWDLDGRTVDALLAIARDAGRPRRVLYTSGVWVYGTTGNTPADESSPLAPPALNAPRPGIEQRVLAGNAGAVRTLVLRPGCVYGGPGSLTATWFEAGAKGARARVIGKGTERWAMVHRDDLADAYVRALESPYGGEVFNVVDRSRFTVLDCARAAMGAAGGTGEPELVPLEKARAELGPFADALALDQHVDARKAASLLGWQPRHGGFVDGVDRYHRAWRAHRA
ncbi:MAG TPA: NAD-dependent epimerase/dehydratase family protein [Polyangiaceae bacterium]|jgi:nucleoside-diphosphate-sugar epimerase